MKKVLVISFDCFNSSSSNGRALGSLLKLTDKLSISQIYIKNGEPNFINGNYCFVNENDLPKHLFNVKKCTRFFKFNNNNEQFIEMSSSSTVNNFPKMRKTPFKMICRNVAWRLASFSLKPIYKWAEDIRPDYVLVQAGDLPFLLLLSKKLAKKYGSKLIFYTTENYPFKKNNYTNLTKKSLIYPFLRRRLYKITKRIVEKADSLLFLTESLNQEYSTNYHINGKKYVLYPCSDIENMHPKMKEDQFIFSYCGNLGIGRGKTLIEIAKILEAQYPNCKLIICGSCDRSTLEVFESIKIVEYKGIVSYNDVIKIYENSDFILHVESFDKLIADDSKHAFSGKIADCISTCRPFIFVGPNNMYEYHFLSSTNSALTFDSIELFHGAVSSGALENYSLDVINQRLVKEKYFSKDKTKRTIEEIFDV